MMDTENKYTYVKDGRYHFFTHKGSKRSGSLSSGQEGASRSCLSRRMACLLFCFANLGRHPIAVWSERPGDRGQEVDHRRGSGERGGGPEARSGNQESGERSPMALRLGD